MMTKEKLAIIIICAVDTQIRTLGMLGIWIFKKTTSYDKSFEAASNMNKREGDVKEFFTSHSFLERGVGALFAALIIGTAKLIKG